MGLVSENWSEYTFKRGVTAQRGFIITGVLDAAEALSDLLNQKGVAEAATHELDSSLSAEQPDIDTKLGPNVYHALANYVPNGGGGGTDGKITWLWRSMTREESVDIDASDPPLPIVNTCHSPFQADFTRPFNSRILIARRKEPSYRSGVADDFENSVNKFRVSIPRLGIFEPGRLKLLSYEPEGEYSVEDDINVPLPCIYQFEVRKGNKLDADGTWDGFKFRIRNDGFMGFHEGNIREETGPGRGPFCSGEGTRLTEPVLLDRDGKPIDTTIKVEKENGVPSAAFKNPKADQIPDKVIETTTTGAAGETSGVVFLKYLKCPVMDFNGLALF